MRKFLVLAIPIVTLALFIAIMLSSTYLKGPLTKDDNIPQVIEGIMDNVNNENWKEVEKDTRQLEGTWNKVTKRIQFSAERDEINFFNANIARLRGAIMAQDKSDALIELNEAYQHWKDIEILKIPC